MRALAARSWRSFSLLGVAALVACGGDEPTVDASPDGGRLDGSSGDASVDSSATDASSDTGADASIAPPGEVTELGACDAGALPSSRCVQLSVQCEGRPDITVDVRISEPTGAARATLVLGTGGGGDGFVEDGVMGPLLLGRLRDAGYRVVQRRWASPGWFVGDGGVRAASCAYAALVGWIDDNVADDNLCAMGLSGGAIELAYALARWDGADRLDGAALLGGPSMTVLDQVCPSAAPNDWTTVGCASAASERGIACGTLYCTLQGAAAVVDSAWGGATYCEDGDPSMLADDGVVGPTGRYDYPTKLAFVVGADECGATFLPFLNAVGDGATLRIVPATPHDVWSTTAGIDASVAAALETCP